jgi:hypothetical protein
MRWKRFAFSLGCLVPLSTLAEIRSFRRAVNVPFHAETYQRRTGDKISRPNTTGRCNRR